MCGGEECFVVVVVVEQEKDFVVVRTGGSRLVWFGLVCVLSCLCPRASTAHPNSRETYAHVHEVPDQGRVDVPAPEVQRAVLVHDGVLHVAGIEAACEFGVGGGRASALELQVPLALS